MKAYCYPNKTNRLLDQAALFDSLSTVWDESKAYYFHFISFIYLKNMGQAHTHTHTHTHTHSHTMHVQFKQLKRSEETIHHSQAYPQHGIVHFRNMIIFYLETKKCSKTFRVV